MQLAGTLLLAAAFTWHADLKAIRQAREKGMTCMIPRTARLIWQIVLVHSLAARSSKATAQEWAATVPPTRALLGRAAELASHVVQDWATLDEMVLTWMM